MTRDGMRALVNSIHPHKTVHLLVACDGEIVAAERETLVPLDDLIGQNITALAFTKRMEREVSRLVREVIAHEKEYERRFIAGLPDGTIVFFVANFQHQEYYLLSAHVSITEDEAMTRAFQEQSAPAHIFLATKLSETGLATWQVAERLGIPHRTVRRWLGVV